MSQYLQTMDKTWILQNESKTLSYWRHDGLTNGHILILEELSFMSKDPKSLHISDQFFLIKTDYMEMNITNLQAWSIWSVTPNWHHLTSPSREV